MSFVQSTNNVLECKLNFSYFYNDLKYVSSDKHPLDAFQSHKTEIMDGEQFGRNMWKKSKINGESFQAIKESKYISR